MKRLVPLPSPAMIVAGAALFAAIGGTNLRNHARPFSIVLP